MDNLTIKNFFDFLENRISLQKRLDEFKSKSQLRQSIWNSDLRVLTLRQYANDELLNISWDLSLEAINTKNIDRINDSILILSIDNRDSLIKLTLINYASDKLKIKLSDVIDLVKNYSDTKAIKYYTQFLERTKAEKSLKAMGLREVIINDEICIEQIPPPWLIK